MCFWYICQTQRLIKITHFHSILSTEFYWTRVQGRNMFRLSWNHHQAIQFTNLKLLNCDSYMDPYVTSIQCVYKTK
jgi:hypothetical protein